MVGVSANKASVQRPKPMNYWNANLRLFFENFAKKRGRDPLLPSSWYIATEELAQQKVIFSWILGGDIKK
jgi:hypothetical protein